MNEVLQVVIEIDHLVLTVCDVAKTCEFYSTALGMEVVEFEEGGRALAFGRQKINLHEVGKEWEPGAGRPTAGSADICLVTSWPMSQLTEHFRALKIDIEIGPVPGTGAQGDIVSIYIRDPDENLIEISSYRFVDE
ncbi:virulence protein [Tateyamaria omphalii]|uniref:VOC family protein n=1 Tax=Tateyamaria omphalii TaxID=299262 RepID=UPI001673154E|nr:VOC family protein [Tateyamaria omphalii]GGX71085.1 virulence protein [Tateyamaria omphalii]